VVKVVEEVKVLAEGRVEPEPCSVACSVLLCIVLISLSGSFISAQTNFSSGPVFVISTTANMRYYVYMPNRYLRWHG
jgi:hypothetical protein